MNSWPSPWYQCLLPTQNDGLNVNGGCPANMSVTSSVTLPPSRTASRTEETRPTAEAGRSRSRDHRSFIAVPRYRNQPTVRQQQELEDGHAAAHGAHVGLARGELSAKGLQLVADAHLHGIRNGVGRPLSQSSQKSTRTVYQPAGARWPAG